MYSPCMRGFSLGALASSHILNTCRLIGDSSGNRGVNVSMNGRLSIRDVEEGSLIDLSPESDYYIVIVVVMYWAARALSVRTWLGNLRVTTAWAKVQSMDRLLERCQFTPSSPHQPLTAHN